MQFIKDIAAILTRQCLMRQKEVPVVYEKEDDLLAQTFSKMTQILGKAIEVKALKILLETKKDSDLFSVQFYDSGKIVEHEVFDKKSFHLGHIIITAEESEFRQLGRKGGSIQIGFLTSASFLPVDIHFINFVLVMEEGSISMTLHIQMRSVTERNSIEQIELILEKAKSMNASEIYFEILSDIRVQQLRIGDEFVDCEIVENGDGKGDDLLKAFKILTDEKMKTTFGKQKSPKDFTDTSQIGWIKLFNACILKTQALNGTTMVTLRL